MAASLGHTGIATYLQSGNLIFASPDDDASRLADALEREIARDRTLRPAVVVLSRAAAIRRRLAPPVTGRRSPGC